MGPGAAEYARNSHTHTHVQAQRHTRARTLTPRLPPQTRAPPAAHRVPGRASGAPGFRPALPEGLGLGLAAPAVLSGRRGVGGTRTGPSEFPRTFPGASPVRGSARTLDRGQEVSRGKKGLPPHPGADNLRQGRSSWCLTGRDPPRNRPVFPRALTSVGVSSCSGPPSCCRAPSCCPPLGHARLRCTQGGWCDRPRHSGRCDCPPVTQLV